MHKRIIAPLGLGRPALHAALRLAHASETPQEDHTVPLLLQLALSCDELAKRQPSAALPRLEGGRLGSFQSEGGIGVTISGLR
jgi:hypothetical protein